MWGKTGSKLYGARSGADYVDNHKRFTLFCKAAIESAKVLPFGPGEDCVFVANDWHSGLVPLLIKVGGMHSNMLVLGWREGADCHACEFGGRGAASGY